jgi:mRNA interferase RelE/StbE
MKIVVMHRASKEYQNLPLRIQQSVDKQFALLENNLRHPSLHAKKYDESANIWQARVDRSYRFYFSIQGDVYFVLSITPHPK